jgi:hypothetical protein
VAQEAASEQELGAYRAELERFASAREEEYYLHFAGYKEKLELEPIFERHAALTDLAAVLRIGGAVSERRNRELFRIGCEGVVAERKRSLEERSAGLQATLTASVDGEEIGYRMLLPNELTEEHLNSLYVEAHEQTQDAARELGAASVFHLYRDRLGFDLDGLGEQCRALLDETADLWEREFDRALRESVGVGLAEAERWDIRRWFRAPAWDSAFPTEHMVPALRATLAGLGVDLDAQPNVILDVEKRPTKSPRAFCSPIEVPDRVMLVIQPMGGVDDWAALFHEAGHAEHFAHASADLLAEEKFGGDLAVTEGWASLLEHLVGEPEWAPRVLGTEIPQALVHHLALIDLYFARRYAAKVLYEIELQQLRDPVEAASLYVELQQEATGIAPSSVNYLADVDDGFYCTEYIRSWALQAQLSAHLRDRYGARWFANADAGSHLRELWELGQRPTADELVRDATGESLRFDALTESIAERLGAHMP